MGVFRLRVEFEDRTGMVYDTSRVIAKYNISILALKVLPNLMYFELECDDEEIKKKIMLDLAPIPNIKKVEEVRYSTLDVPRDDPFHIILGESGTGKELFAKAIHLSSPRSKFPFYPVNCAALPEKMFKS